MLVSKDSYAEQRRMERTGKLDQLAAVVCNSEADTLYRYFIVGG